MRRLLRFLIIACCASAQAAVPPVAQQCVGCHEASPGPGNGRVPDLAGQGLYYLRKQLLDYKYGRRRGDVMPALSASLTEQEIDQLALYFSALPYCGVTQAPMEEGSDYSAPPLVFCVRCHGRDGRAPNALWPSLAGQKREYLRQQMRAFEAGGRYDPMMAAWAGMVTPKQEKQILDYFSGSGACSH